MTRRKKPKGWRNEPGRHALAAKGVRTTNACKGKDSNEQREMVSVDADELIKAVFAGDESSFKEVVEVNDELKYDKKNNELRGPPEEILFEMGKALSIAGDIAYDYTGEDAKKVIDVVINNLEKVKGEL